jgi:hypothetical protein
MSALFGVIGGLVLLYVVLLSILASKLVWEDVELLRGAKIARVLAIWCVPLLGAILSLMISLEFASVDGRARLWRWLARPYLPRPTEGRWAAEPVDLVEDAERRLPGITGWAGRSE